MIAHDALYASIFGVHYHACPSARCQGAQRSCSDQYDCQPVPRLCRICAIVDSETESLRNDWREIDRLLHTGVGI